MKKKKKEEGKKKETFNPKPCLEDRPNLTDSHQPSSAQTIILFRCLSDTMLVLEVMLTLTHLGSFAAPPSGNKGQD